MPGLINAHWYARNAATGYPFDDRAGASDAGDRPPPDILADLNLRWPRSLGESAYVAALSLTGTLVTLVIQAADDLDGAPTAMLATLTLPRSSAVGRVHRLAAHADGINGWVVFGPGLINGTTWTGRFSTPRRGLLNPRAARPYRQPGVLAVKSAQSRSWLTGLVRLRAEPPLQLTAETRSVDGRTVTALVLALADDVGQGAFPVPAAAAEQVVDQALTVFQEFYGPCGGRPESRSCSNPAPIETLAGVAPDCDGVITIVFSDCAQPIPLVGVCGAALRCDVGLAVTCPRPRIPDENGVLPSEQNEVVVPEIPPVQSVEPPTGTELPPENLPYTLCSAGSAPDPGDAVVLLGAWEYPADTPPVDPCGSGYVFRATLQSFRNLLAAVDVGGTLGRRATADVHIETGTIVSVRRNAGVAFNIVEIATGVYSYYVASADYTFKQFRLLYFTGSGFTELASVATPGLEIGGANWYRVEVEVVPGVDPGSIAITATLSTLNGSPAAATIGPISPGPAYGTGAGLFGLANERCISRFSRLIIEEV